MVFLFLLKTVSQVLEKTFSAGKVTKKLIENFVCTHKNMAFTFILTPLSPFFSVFGNSISWNWTVGME